MKGVTLVRVVPTVMVLRVRHCQLRVRHCRSWHKGVALSHPLVGKSPVRARQQG